MSGGRSTRRRIQREHLASSLRSTDGETAVYVATLDHMHELYQCGAVLFVVPRPAPPDAPSEIRDAIDIRRGASLEGRCACGAVRRLRTSHGQPRLVMFHKRTCPAADDALLGLADRLGWRWAA